MTRVDLATVPINAGDLPSTVLLDTSSLLGGTITLEEFDPNVGTVNYDCTTALSDAQTAALTAGGATIELLPGKTYYFASPVVMNQNPPCPIRTKPGRGTTLKAMASFSAGINGSNQFVKNWVDADYSGTEKSANPTTYGAMPPANVGTSLSFYGHLSGMTIDASAVSGLTPVAWSSPNETTRIQELILKGSGGAIGMDIGGALNGVVILDQVTLYGGNDVWTSAIRCHPTSGSDIYLNHWTTAPSAHVGSVFDFSGVINIKIESFQCEGYVDPGSGVGPAVFNFVNCKGVSLRSGQFSVNQNATLEHPLVQATNTHGSGFGISSPKIDALQISTGSFSNPWTTGIYFIEDSAQSGNVQQHLYAGESFISVYDGNEYSYLIGSSGVGAVTTLQAAPSLMRSGAAAETVDRALAGIGNTQVSGAIMAGRVIIAGGRTVTQVGFVNKTVNSNVTHMWVVLMDPAHTENVVAVSADLLATQQLTSNGLEVVVPFAASYTPSSTASYDIGLCVIVSTGALSIFAAQGGAANLLPTRGGTSNTGETGGPPSLGTSMTTPAPGSGGFSYPYFWIG